MLKVMIAEDDLFMAHALADNLNDNGYDVCGTASTVERGIELGRRHKPDLAVLDIRLLAGRHGKEIAARLKDHFSLGILYVTGNYGVLGAWGLTKSDGDACLGKPFTHVDFLRAMQIVEKIAKTGIASPPFPNCFHLLGSPAMPTLMACS
jgi:DNA-binding response OmpR family regulator